MDVHVVVEVVAECHRCRAQCRRCNDHTTGIQRDNDPQKASFVRESYLDWHPAYEAAIRRQVAWIEHNAQASLEATRGILAMRLSVIEKLELLHYVVSDLEHLLPVRFNVIKLPLTGSEDHRDGEDSDLAVDRRCNDRDNTQAEYQNETKLAIEVGESSNSKRRKALMITNSSTMDPELWGNLPLSVAVEIYKRLPIRDFFNLRETCKDWNIVACQHRCFTDPIPKPYFVLITLGEKTKDYIHGMLTYNVTPGRWMYKMSAIYMRGLLVQQFEEPFSVEGLVFEGSKFLSPRPRGLDELIQTQVLAPYCDRKLGLVVVDMHTGERIHTPQVPVPTKTAVIGMVVDSSRRPYGCKVIVGSLDARTQIYDSESMTWETKCSFLVRVGLPRTSWSPKSCIYFDGAMYVWSDLDEILVYFLEEDKWATLEPPPRCPGDQDFRGLGHWEGRVYAVTKNEQGTLSVWMLVESQEWREFDRIPGDLFSWLHQGKVPIVTKHCDEYLLFYADEWESRPGRRLVLFNIALKRWEIVNLPPFRYDMDPDYRFDYIFSDEEEDVD